MKGNKSSCILLIVVLAVSMFLWALPQITVSATPDGIDVDGKFEDWAGIDPLDDYVDATGDTEPWSTDTVILGQGNTSETAAQVPWNDMARDLKAIYLTLDSDAELVYIRLDVVNLSANWGYGSGGLNASTYDIYFDTNLRTSAGQYDMGQANDLQAAPQAYWERHLVWENSTYAFFQGIKGADPWGVIDTTTGHGGNIVLKENTTHNFFEISIPFIDFPVTPISMRIFVVSYKPGERCGPESGEIGHSWAVWETGSVTHAFDPQLPGRAGECDGYEGDPYTPPAPAGNDAADIMPGGSVAQGGMSYDNGVDGKGIIIGSPHPNPYLKTGPAPPVAIFSYSPLAPWPKETVYFDASASIKGWNISDQRWISYEWDFDDLTPKVTIEAVLGLLPTTITHRYTTTGTYNVTLKVTCEPGVTPNTDTTWGLITVVTGYAKTITIDGILSDWAGVDPVYNDTALHGHDTQPWSTNAAILSYGNTSEAGGEITANDKARDLEALFVAADDNYVYFRLDVTALPSAYWGDGWSVLNYTGDPMATPPPGGYDNASSYAILIDTDFELGSGAREVALSGDEEPTSSVLWERRITLTNGTGIMLVNSTGHIIDDTNTTLHTINICGIDNYDITGQLLCAMNVSAGSFEMAIPRDDFGDWDEESLRVMVASWKPGEFWRNMTDPKAYGALPTGGGCNGTKAFDPQAPGTNGEIWSNSPGASASGSDLADVMPGGVDGLEVLTDPATRVGTILGYLTVSTPEPLDDAAVIFVQPMGLLEFAGGGGCNAAYVRWHQTWAYGFDIEVFVKNLGTVAKTFTVNLQNNSDTIGTQSVTLDPHENDEVTFTWTPFENRSYPDPVWGFQQVWPYPTRDIKATLTSVGGDENAANNELVFGTLTIRYPGDVGRLVGNPTTGDWAYTAADGKVGSFDLFVFGKWGWNADRNAVGKMKTKYEVFGFWCDFDHDGKVLTKDLQVLGKTWGDNPKAGTY